MGGALVEITDRSVQGRFLLCPSPVFNRIVLEHRAQEIRRVADIH